MEVRESEKYAEEPGEGQWEAEKKPRQNDNPETKKIKHHKAEDSVA